MRSSRSCSRRAATRGRLHKALPQVRPRPAEPGNLSPLDGDDGAYTAARAARPPRRAIPRRAGRPAARRRARSWRRCAAAAPTSTSCTCGFVTLVPAAPGSSCRFRSPGSAPLPSRRRPPSLPRLPPRRARRSVAGVGRLDPSAPPSALRAARPGHAGPADWVCAGDPRDDAADHHRRTTSLTSSSRRRGRGCARRWGRGRRFVRRTLVSQQSSRSPIPASKETRGRRPSSPSAHSATGCRSRSSRSTRRASSRSAARASRSAWCPSRRSSSSSASRWWAAAPGTGPRRRRRALRFRLLRRVARGRRALRRGAHGARGFRC